MVYVWVCGEGCNISSFVKLSSVSDVSSCTHLLAMGCKQILVFGEMIFYATISEAIMRCAPPAHDQ